MKAQKKTNRHGRYKVGTVKLTVTVDNEDKLRVEHRAQNRGYKDVSSFLREAIHQAVWDEPLLPEDYEKLAEMTKAQEA